MLGVASERLLEKGGRKDDDEEEKSSRVKENASREGKVVERMARLLTPVTRTTETTTRNNDNTKNKNRKNVDEKHTRRCENVCWAYCAALRASNNALAKIPISTALDVVCPRREVEEFEEGRRSLKNYARGKLNGCRAMEGVCVIASRKSSVFRR